MKALLPVAAACIALYPHASLAAQEGAQEPAGKAILKREVDDLIRMLRSAAGADGGLGDGSCQHTAMVLTAAGHCHRFYYAGDGPWIRQALQHLFAARQPDGTFAEGDAAGALDTTRWVQAALHVLDPEGHASDLQRIRAVLAQRGAGDAGSPFDELVQAVAATADSPAEAVLAAEARAGTIMASMPRGVPMRADGRPDLGAAAEALASLVACQVVARHAGLPPRLTPQSADSAPPAWSNVQQRGFDFLLGQQQDGVFFVAFGGQKFPDAGLTAIGLAALQTKPAPLRSEAEQALITAGLDWLVSQQDEQGGFGQSNVNYNTCAAVMALSEAREAEGRYAAALKKAQRFVLFLQNIEERGYGERDRDYGSIGYGGDLRGDLSNLQFAVDALRRTELDPQHEALQKALVFLQRLQNYEAVNDYRERVRVDGEWQDVAPGDDGGAAYYPGNSPAGYIELTDGTRVPRSYGSMSYALLKTYILCGLPPTDHRVQAVVRWIRANWTLETNPGADPALGKNTAYQGLYYYYMVLAQALDLVGIDRLETGPETSVDWRAELAQHLQGLQRQDGSWLNDGNGRWWEDQPLVCTVYALLALQRCRP